MHAILAGVLLTGLLAPGFGAGSRELQVDTTAIESWTAVTRSDTMTGSITLFNEALSKLEYTLKIIAEKTFSKVYLVQDSLSGWYDGRLGVRGKFYVISHRWNKQSGEILLFGTGKIKIIPVRILIRFSYDDIGGEKIIGAITIHLDKRFPFLERLVEREVRKTLRYMRIAGQNLSEDLALREGLRNCGTYSTAEAGMRNVE